MANEPTRYEIIAYIPDGNGGRERETRLGFSARLTRAAVHDAMMANIPTIQVLLGKDDARYTVKGGGKAARCIVGNYEVVVAFGDNTEKTIRTLAKEGR